MSAGPGAGWRVLVVDDAADIRLLAGLALRELGGFVVDEAGDGGAALAAVGGLRPDVVLLDVQLPDMDGPQVLSALRARHPEVPVVFLTGVRGGELETLGALGADGVLHKPFQVDTLADELAALLEQRGGADSPA